MKDIEKIMAEILPSTTYERLNFNNTDLIDKLSQEDKNQLEDALISRLLSEYEKNIDDLIITSLAYMKSQKSVPTIEKMLDQCINSELRIVMAASIFEINGDNRMADIAVNAFKELNNVNDAYYAYKIVDSFYYLMKFKNVTVENIINEYTNHKDYLIAYNARRSLGLIKDPI